MCLRKPRKPLVPQLKRQAAASPRRQQLLPEIPAGRPTHCAAIAYGKRVGSTLTGAHVPARVALHLRHRPPPSLATCLARVQRSKGVRVYANTQWPWCDALPLHLLHRGGCLHTYALLKPVPPPPTRRLGGYPECRSTRIGGCPPPPVPDNRWQRRGNAS